MRLRPVRIVAFGNANVVVNLEVAKLRHGDADSFDIRRQRIGKQIEADVIKKPHSHAAHTIGVMLIKRVDGGKAVDALQHVDRSLSVRADGSLEQGWCFGLAALGHEDKTEMKKRIGLIMGKLPEVRFGPFSG